MKSPRVRLDPRSFLAGFVVVILLLLGAGFVVSQASGPKSVGHSMADVWCENTSGCIISSWILDGAVITSKLADASVTTLKVADNSISRQKLQADSVDSSKVVNNSVKAVDVDSAEIQRRVSQDCVSVGGSIQRINSDGTVFCLAPGLTTVQQSFLFSAPPSTVEISCPVSHPVVVDCDVYYDGLATQDIYAIAANKVVVGSSTVCRASIQVNGVDLTHPFTITAEALCSK